MCPRRTVAEIFFEGSEQRVAAFEVGGVERLEMGIQQTLREKFVDGDLRQD